MKTVLKLALLFGLGSLPALAGESGHLDKEAPLVKDGVLGTVNVLRELDVKTGKNRVKVESNYKFSTDPKRQFPINWVHPKMKKREQ